MKKFLAILLVVTSVSLAANAQTDSARKSGYYYYPESNVYYNTATKTYSYFDQNTSKWNTVTALPLTYKITPETRKATINYSGTQIWTDNKQHQTMYGQPAPDKNTTIPPSQMNNNNGNNNTTNTGANPPPKPLQ